ncbi:ABC transporter ATP-binding protein [Alkaliphilus hydrothermalis]|uniref:Fluoroquinolone transport system ATP-binding protein n=1 Tax=Alkaliphilus hydrothermalis TaxID=1482730 RepID=A0ABS2NNE0_9FIRM|nr:ABC transporter ATP-binding protein [Alkaliphilus hydrothermalis]MBM7614465.1 fluoroquinolone transport system ATP-binding protein [Alkaliphilus hydrothermalis]
MIQVKNLHHDYSGKGKYAVNDISFEIKKGEIFGFLGPSGAGKSTVQNIMTGLLKIQKGEVLNEGKSISEMKNSFYNEIGVSFEHPNLYAKLTGYENLKYYAGLFNVPTLDPMELLDAVGLAESANKRANAYSKGMKQRLVLARALLNNPSILFLDEPTSGLDPATANKVKEIIKRKQQEGCTVFLTTHNMYAAEELCNRVAFLNDGKIVACDSPRNLKLQYGENSVKVEYIGKDGDLKKKIFFLDNEDERSRFNEVVNTEKIQTIHTQEATLEQIFIKLTGRELA